MASWGTLLGGAGALLGAVGGFWGSRVATSRALRDCRERQVDLETTVGVLLSLMPGGALAEQFGMYRREQDQGIVTLLEGVRARWRARNGIPAPTV